jgi:hypothetical protein
MGIGNGEWGIGHRKKQRCKGAEGKDLLLLLLCSPAPLLPCSPAPLFPNSPPLINKTNTSKEISNCGVGKIARLKQNNIRNLTSSVNRGTTIKTDKCFMLQ